MMGLVSVGIIMVGTNSLPPAMMRRVTTLPWVSVDPGHLGAGGAPLFTLRVGGRCEGQP